MPKEISLELNAFKIYKITKKREEKRSFFTIGYFIEVLLLAIHPIPFFNARFEVSQLNKDGDGYIRIPYFLSEFLLAFMFLRIILLIRAIFNYTMFTDLYAKKLW